MRPIRWLVAVVLLGVAAQASAASPLAQLKGHWAFDWSKDPAKQKCAEVSGELLKDFYADAYVHTRKACDAERLMQAANGD